MCLLLAFLLWSSKEVLASTILAKKSPKVPDWKVETHIFYMDSGQKFKLFYLIVCVLIM